MADEVTLLSFWINPHESQIALEEKGVMCVNSEEDLRNKSTLSSTPTESSPILLVPPSSSSPAVGNARSSSPVTVSPFDPSPLQHIDEMWKDKAPLLPSDLYERTHSIPSDMYII
ncbi:hypothetical protein DKX38_026065 [Salix brachista]|uniref:Uncharacterized protein n=1 Tax=Salix brachista TaxID=2182728 RepID=A0A5N5JSI5_9ROSI|nr:hypothetical protein DKX38_026065 [Salix brachista]